MEGSACRGLLGLGLDFGSMSRVGSKLRLAAAVVWAASFAATGVLAASAQRAGSPPSVLDMRGTPIPLSQLPPKFLAHSGIRAAYLLATNHGRFYFRLVRPGHVCFAVGRAVSTPGIVQCFPTDARPSLIDFSVWEQSRSDPRLHLWRFEGLAADGIARLAVLAVDGKVIATVPVTRGIYYLASPPKTPVGWIIEYDSHGHVLSRRSISR
jgi:hypothetical protein